MLAAFAALAPFLGSITSVLPLIFNFFEKRADRKQEIELKKLDMELVRMQMEAAAQGFDFEKAMVEVRAHAEQQKELYKHDTALVEKVDSKWVNILRASVRPVITYAFFFIFLFIKIGAAITMMTQGYTIPDVMDVIWDVYTASIFGAIMGFWFGSRLIEKLQGR